MWNPTSSLSPLLRPVAVALTVTLALALSGCAGLRSVESDVSTFSKWPAQRKPSTFVFERLPSQQARPQQQARFELLARNALQKAGFTPAEEGKPADVTVQVGVRASRADRSPFDDPLWWRGGVYYSRSGRPVFFHGPMLMYQFDAPRYEREVAVLIRDQGDAEPLYEARAVNDGNTPGGDDLLEAMFQAALQDFPHTGINPRTVVIQLKK
ncbi:MAG: hypothetical protein RLZZ618_1265 [Pseudomonadota bacterium]|jgi:hypothetical protein